MLNSQLPVYLIEIKSKWITDLELHPPPEEFVDLVLKEIVPLGINDRVIIQSFDMRPLNILHKLNAGFRLGMLVRSPRLIRRRMNSLNFIPDTCGIYYKLANEKWIKRIHTMGMKALVWTENEKEDMKYHLSLGVDGIITDYPALGLEIIGMGEKK
jgi:glycerophosphoryl diester phosphodiesterase